MAETNESEVGTPVTTQEDLYWGGPSGEIVTEVMDQIIATSKKRESLAGHSTGIPQLDGATLGLEGGQLVVIAARPGCGKTDLILHMIGRQSCEAKTKVLMITTKARPKDLVARLLGATTSVDCTKLRSGFLRPAELSSLRDGVPQLYEAPLRIEQMLAPTLASLMAEVTRSVAADKSEVVYIDTMSFIEYWQQGLSRWEEVAGLSRALKTLALRLDVPIVVTVSLARGAEESRGPRISDLAEGGSLEHDADLILLLSKGVEVGKAEGRGILERDLTIAKQVRGTVGTIKIYHELTTGRITTLA